MRRKLRILSLSLVGLFLLACGVAMFPILRDVLIHDLAFARQERTFRTLAHPQGTRFVAYKKYLGLYLGNSNHCDYFLGELRQYSLDRQAVESFYAAQSSTSPEVGILFLEDGEFPENSWVWMPYRFDSLSTWLTSPDSPRDHLYLVYDSGILSLDPGWDFRCS